MILSKTNRLNIKGVPATLSQKISYIVWMPPAIIRICKIIRHTSYQGRDSGRALGCDSRRGHPGAVKERPSHVRGQVSRVRSGF